MDASEVDNEPGSNARPPLLTLLCVLTFISTSLGGISALVIPIFPNEMVGIIKSSPEYNEASMNEILQIIQAGWGYYSITFLLAMGSMTGAILMWKLKKIGFHFYSLSNLVLLIIPTLMLGLTVSWLSIILTAGYIALYATNLKFMK